MKEAVTGTDEFWTQQREGVSLIRRYRNALAYAESEPQYYATGMNEDGEPTGIYENIDPYHPVVLVEGQLLEHPAARRILTAQVERIDGHYRPKFKIKNGFIYNTANDMVPKSRDISIFGEEKKPTRRPR